MYFRINELKARLKAFAEKAYHKATYFNFDLSSLTWKQLEKTSKNKWPAAVEGFLRLAYFMLGSLRYRSFPDIKCDVLFVVGSENNKKSVMPVIAGQDRWCVLGYNSAMPKDAHIPEMYFYLNSVIRIYRLLLAISFCKEPYIRWAMKKRFDRYLLSFGSVGVWKKILEFSECKTLVLSNDHIVWTRTARVAAAELGIRTVFLPHAPTGDSPPPFEFDVGCMDGVEQLRRYRPWNKLNPLMVLTGAVRYEALAKNEVPEGEGFLFCFNTMDSLEFIEQSLEDVRNAVPEAYIGVRPHPADLRRLESIRQICVRLEITFFDPSTNLLANLEGVRWVFAGVSGVHVDALMANRQPATLGAWYSSDYYGLREAGLLRVIDSWKSLPDIAALRSDEFRAKVINLNWNFNDRSLSPAKAVAELICYVTSAGCQSDVGGAFETASFTFSLRPAINKFSVFQVNSR